MNYYIADTHFGHGAILNFDHRPFGSLEEMEEIIIMNWNAAVRPGDTVYILGDFCWGKADEWLWIVLEWPYEGKPRLLLEREIPAS